MKTKSKMSQFQISRAVAAYRAHVTRIELKAIECGNAKEGKKLLAQAREIERKAAPLVAKLS